MRTYIFFLSLGISLLSCTKEIDYSEIDNSCKLCAFASQAEGNYRGLMTWDSVYVGVPVATLSDSVTVEVEQIFMNFNAYDDSTTMYFKTTWVRDQVGLIHADTIQIHQKDGTVSFYSNTPYMDHSYVERFSYIRDGIYRKYSEYKGWSTHILHVNAILNKI